MAIDVLNQIKAAEEKAEETRRVAAMAAKDALKLAQQENSEYKEKELAKARHEAIAVVDAAQKAAQAELDAQQNKRLEKNEELKQNAQKKLSQAADVCLERILA